MNDHIPVKLLENLIAMRILMVADPMLPVPPKHYGGIERVIDMLIREYTRIGHEVLLVAHPDSDTGGELVALPGLSWESKVDMGRNALLIARHALRFRADLVHSFGRLAQLLPLMPFRIPKIMSYQREPDLHGIAMAARLSRNKSLIFTGCSDYISNRIGDVAHVRTIYNGVPLSVFNFQPAVAADAPLVCLGRIERIKGVHNAIDIAIRSGRRLVIAGNIPEGDEHRRYFSQQVEPFLGRQIEYVGPVDDVQKNVLLGGAAALVMAIEWNEPFGIVMAESLACGTPVLGTPLGAIPEIVTHGVNGFVARTNEELAEFVSELSAVSREACRATCANRFADRVVAKEYLKLYSRMSAPRLDISAVA
ncbi:MAG: glycosyltransferase [Planctomycetaceae bacterium]|nr:glycosyltransferase [Planctomycetaceae bacterium]MCA9083673.1 glycosyltransferase [Planctomycetaceae bacterium]